MMQEIHVPALFILATKCFFDNISYDLCAYVEYQQNINLRTYLGGGASIT